MICKHELIIPTATNEWCCEICGEMIDPIVVAKRLDELDNYKRGFIIWMEYWESLPDEEKPEIDKALKKLDL